MTVPFSSMKYPESIKLLAIDLDGTLLCKDLTFHSQILLAFSAAKANNLTIVIATGRSIQSASHIVKPLNHEGHYVCANGCHVVDRDGNTLYQNHLNNDVKRTLIHFAQSRNLHITTYTPEGPCTLSNGRFLDQYKKLIQGLPVPIVSPEKIMNSEAHKIVFIAEPPRITLLRNEINSLLPKDQADMTESAPEYLEILPSGTNKSTGLNQLCQHLGLSENAVAAIGDYRNDYEMLNFVGFPVAIGNALPEIKAIARHIVKPNSDGGVAQLIFEIIAHNQRMKCRQ